MGYSAQVIARAQQRLAEQKADKESRHRAALAEAYTKEPRLREIDSQLRRTMTLAARSAFQDGTDAREAMAAAKEANLALIDAVKQGGPGVTVLPPLFLRDEQNQTTGEYREIYEVRV